ncbi:hypothetical protein [Microcoleus sp. AT13-A6]|uniref:hypothetical protein n=1 Tax=Microcoleus sp. AT13-A6 TaxID=2818591 RepID=UPI002FD0D4BA
MQANNFGAADYCNRLVRLPKIRQSLTMIVRLPHPSVGEGISRLSGKVKIFVCLIMEEMIDAFINFEISAVISAIDKYLEVSTVKSKI